MGSIKSAQVSSFHAGKKPPLFALQLDGQYVRGGEEGVEASWAFRLTKPKR